MAKKRTYVKYSDIEQIQKDYDPNYIIMYGGRNDGKSYAAKEKALRDYFKDGSMFCYLRRYDADIREVDNVDYWADFMTEPNKISELSGGEYNAIQYEKGKFYLATVTEEKAIRGPAVGYCHALSKESRYKSLQFPEVGTVIYEEFCTDGMYLFNEVKHFMMYISTIARDRRITVLLIGNTISRQNAFFREWQLTGIAEQTAGSIDIYRFKHDESEIVIAAYYTNAQKDNKMFFGSAAKMITGGDWESHEQPHLNGKESDYTEIYRMTFETDILNRFLMRLMVDKDGTPLWYVTKRTSDIKPHERIISPKLYYTPYYTAGFTPLTSDEKAAFIILDQGRIAYGDNLTGTEFKRAMKQLNVIRKE